MHDEEEKKDIYIVETKAFAESKISKPSLTFIRWLSRAHLKSSRFFCLTNLDIPSFLVTL